MEPGSSRKKRKDPNKIINENLNVRQVEETTKEEEFAKKVKQTPKIKNKEYEILERDLADYLGTKVKVKTKKIEINYTYKVCEKKCHKEIFITDLDLEGSCLFF